MGGIGSLLMFIGAIPIRFASIISFVGLILLLVALYSYAGIYRERGIFNNFLYGILIGIVGAVVAAGVAIATVLASLMTLLYALYPGWNGDWMALSGMTPDISNITPGNILPLVGGLILVIVIAWVVIIVVAIFMRRSFNALAAKTNVNLFSTAALILLIGAFLTILAVGFLLIWISFLLIAIAFFKMKPQPEYTAPPVATAPPASTTA